MKKLISLLVTLIAAAALCAVPAAAADVGAVNAGAYIVIEAETGQVLYSRSENAEMHPASVTKIMTVGLACEKAQGDWETMLTVSHDDVYSLAGTDSSHIALLEGETVRLQDMLYAAAVVSANDACNVLAEYVGGSIEGGVAAMNAKAAELGLENTHFSNPHGISEDDHYTTAADLAVIMQWALKQPGFYTLFSRAEMYEMPATNIHEARNFWPQDKLRNPASKFYNSDIKASKIGFTMDAQQTYVCYAEKDGLHLIVVLLHDMTKKERYADMTTLLEAAAANFHYVTPDDALPEVTVQGGGKVLGESAADLNGVQLLLSNSLSEDAITLTSSDTEYVLGGDAPEAIYAVSGGSAQNSCTVTIPLRLTGLTELVGSMPAEVQSAPRTLMDYIRLAQSEAEPAGEDAVYAQEDEDEDPEGEETGEQPAEASSEAAQAEETAQPEATAEPTAEPSEESAQQKGGILHTIGSILLLLLKALLVLIVLFALVCLAAYIRKRIRRARRRRRKKLRAKQK